MLVHRVVVLMLAGLSLTAQEPLGPAKNGVNSCSLEKEAALGKQVAAHFRQRTKPIDSPNVQNYLERLGKRIAAQMPAEEKAARGNFVIHTGGPKLETDRQVGELVAALDRLT